MGHDCGNFSIFDIHKQKGLTATGCNTADDNDKKTSFYDGIGTTAEGVRKTKLEKHHVDT